MTEEQEKTPRTRLTAPDSELQNIGPGVWFDEEEATVIIDGKHEDLGELRKELESLLIRLKLLDKREVVVLATSEIGLAHQIVIPLRDASVNKVILYLMSLARSLRQAGHLTHYHEAAAHFEEALTTFKMARMVEKTYDRAITLFPITQKHELLDSLHRKLTPNYLTDTLGPYLVAIAEIQAIINEIQGKEHREVVIRSIAQQSPISISLDGASQAIQVITDTVVPWRRKHAEEIARLATLEKQAEIESKKAEVLEKRARAAKDRAEAERLAAEAVKQREEAERTKLENEKLRIELHRAKIQLALDVLAQVAPNLPETERIAYTVRLLAPLDTIVSSELEIITDE